MRYTPKRVLFGKTLESLRNALSDYILNVYRDFTADPFTFEGDVKIEGDLHVGTHSAIGAETVTGYITIKDSGGTDRKIAVVS